MKVLYTARKEHQMRLSELIARPGDGAGGEEVRRQVWNILEAVRQGGDAVLFHYAQQLDKCKLGPQNIEVSAAEMDHAVASRTKKEVTAALERAAQRIRHYHAMQKMESYHVMDPNGMKIMQRVQPLSRVGIYVPGGKAVYPSSVLMAAIPAKVAGVSEVVMVTPVKGGTEIDPHILAAARIAGVDRVFRVGGPHAIAALAYGTDSVPQVDKIVGPGNVYVDTAKRLLYGVVDIDMTAGPSEVLILADQTAYAPYLAADLIAQAEHDEDTRCLLVMDTDRLVEPVQHEIERQIQNLPRRDIAKKALDSHGAIVVCRDMPEGVEIANRFAPEHLQIYTAEPQPILGSIRSAGAIFIGRFSPASLGDYVAGTNHILPTGGSARFFSPLSTYDFLKRSSVVMSSLEALAAEGPHLINLARSEELDGHAETVRVRLTDPKAT